MSTHEIDSIIDDLVRGYDGDAWHGPPLRKVLEGVRAEGASAHPVSGGHSIREMVAHLAAWEDVVVRRIEERRAIDSPEAGDFPPIDNTGPVAWELALTELDAGHAELLRTVSGLDPLRLQETVPGKDYSIGHMLRGAVQHMAYHAGQIALLRKLVAVPGNSVESVG